MTQQAGANTPTGVQGLLDLQGDGLADHWLGSAFSQTASFATNNGTLFSPPSVTTSVRPSNDGRPEPLIGCTICTSNNILVEGYRWDTSRTSDLDLDGRVDVTQQLTPNATRFSYLNLGGNFGGAVSAIGWGFALAHTIVVSAAIPMYTAGPVSGAGPFSWEVRSDMVDLDGDGIPEGVDFQSNIPNVAQFKVSTLPRPTQPPRLLASVNNGRGATTTITYTSISDPSIPKNQALGKRMPQTQWVVSSKRTIDSSASPATTTDTSYAYADPEFVADDDGKFAFRGFDKVTTTLPSGAKREDTYSFTTDWSGRLTKSVMIPLEAPTNARTVDKTTWEERQLFTGLLKTYHPTVSEHFVCSNGQTADDCVLLPAGYSKQTSMLTALSGRDDPGSTPIMYQLQESVLQGGATAADGDRKTVPSFTLYGVSPRYVLLDGGEDRFHRVAGTFTLYAGTSSAWDTSARVVTDSSVRIGATTYAMTHRSYDMETGNLTSVWKPKQWAANPFETNPSRTSFGYDDRKLFVASEVNEIGHQVDYVTETGTGTRLSTRGPNTPFCLGPPITCPAGSPQKEEHRIRVDGLGRMIERYETYSDDGVSYVSRKVETNTYVDSTASSVTHQAAIDVNPATQVIRYTQDKTDLDGHGRAIRKTIYALGSAAADQITSYQYRNDGTLQAVLVPDPSLNNASTVSFAYTFDSLGRPLTIRRPDAVAPQESGVNITYSGLSQTSTEVLGLLGGQPASTTTTNDVFGRLVTVEEQRTASPIAWSTTTYSYGPDDNVKTILDPEGVTTALVHDFAGRRTQITRNTRVWTYGYDANGNMTSETTPCTGAGCAASYTTTVAFDALDRPSSKALAPRTLTSTDRTLFGASSETFTWDTGANGKSRLTQWQSFGPSGPAVSTFAPSYNAQGQQLNLTETTNAAGYSNLSRSFQRNFNLAGAPVTTFYRDVVGIVNCQSGSSSTHTYDNRGLPYDVQAVQCVNTGTPNSYVRNTRNVAGLVTKRNSVVGSGAITYAESNWTYDTLGRVTSQIVNKGVAPYQEVARQVLAYFGNDDPKSMDHWLGGTNQKHFNFTYDLRHQLTNVGETQLPNAFTATYTYGNAGRFASAVESAAALPNSEVTARNVTYVYSATDPERITKLKKNPGTKSLADYTYDDAGNQLTRSYPDSKDLWEYVYDGKNQLRRVTRKFNGVVQGSEEYWYNGSNARYLVVKKNAGNTKTGAVWFIEDTEAYYDATGAVTRAFGHVSMGTPVLRIDRSSDAPSILEYQFHGLANNTLATVDQVSGTINASFTFAPFGEVVEATNGGGGTSGLAMHRRRMNDKFVDEVSGLGYYGYRYYDRLSMTWTQADPLYRFAPDSAWVLPRRAQLYTANLNNPLRYVDPDGREPGTDALKVAGGLAMTGNPVAELVATGIVLAVATVAIVSNVDAISRPIASKIWDWVKDAVRPAPLPPPTPPQADDDEKTPDKEKPDAKQKPDGDYRQPGDGERLPEPPSGPPRPPGWPENVRWPPYWKRPPLGPMKCLPDFPTESAPESTHSIGIEFGIESGGNSGWNDANEAAWMYSENQKGDTPSEAFR